MRFVLPKKKDGGCDGAPERSYFLKMSQAPRPSAAAPPRTARIVPVLEGAGVSVGAGAFLFRSGNLSATAALAADVTMELQGFEDGIAGGWYTSGVPVSDVSGIVVGSSWPRSPRAANEGRAKPVLKVKSDFML